MAFTIKSILMQRIEFVSLASQEGSNMSLLCKRFNITRRTGYKWLKRYMVGGINNLQDHSRRPGSSPNRVIKDIEDYVIKKREEDHWGSKKLHKIICQEREAGMYPYEHIPCKNTMTRILKRNGKIGEEASEKAKHWQRFEYENPNDLWQMDFKGYITLEDKTQCHPLTILDDHSRFNIGLFACRNETSQTVKEKLIIVFKKYGLPDRMLMDNGSPWGTAYNNTHYDTPSFTGLEKWLITLNICVMHGRPYHPQTQGKDERFHRTFNTELLQYERYNNIHQCDPSFEKFREKYNCIRPHESLNMETPASRYQPSNRSYTEAIKSPEYNLSDIKRKVDEKGHIYFKGKKYRVGKALYGETVVLRPELEENLYNVYFYNQNIRTLNLKE